MGKEQTDVKVSPWLTVNSFYFSSLAHSGSVTDSSAFPQPFVPLTATPAIYLHCENLNLSCWLFADLQRTQTLQRHEYRSAAKLVTWDLLEKELTWPMWKIQVLAEISVMINKFHLSKASHLLLSISMSWKLQRGFWVFLYLLIFVTPIWYKILHFISTDFVAQAGRKHKYLNYLWYLPGRWDKEKSRTKPSYGKGNRV